MKNRAFVRLAAIGLCATIAFSLIGCLDADETSEVSYDKARDQFAVLMLYQHIRGDEGELPGLLALYHNRNNLLLIPTVRILGETQALRLAGDQLAAIDMGSPIQDLKAIHSPIQLGSIQIMPGEFFLNGGNDLCYAHQLIIPGSVADDSLAWINQWLKSPDRGKTDTDGFNEFHRDVDAELAARAAGKEQTSWKDFTAKAIAAAIADLDQANQPPPPKPAAGTLALTPETQPAPTTQAEIQAEAAPTTQPNDFAYDPLDIASLTGLRNAAEQGKVVLSRNGPEFSVRLPLAPADVTGAIAFFNDYRQAIRNKLAQLASAKSDKAAEAQLLIDLMNATTFSAFDPTDIQISFNVSTFYQTAHLTAKSFDDLAPDDQAKAAAFATLAAKQAPVNAALTVDEVKQKFLAGEFVVHPQQPPVKPGDGLGTIVQLDPNAKN